MHSDTPTVYVYLLQDFIELKKVVCGIKAAMCKILWYAFEKNGISQGCFQKHFETQSFMIFSEPTTHY